MNVGFVPNCCVVVATDVFTHGRYFQYVDDSTAFDACNNSSVPLLQEYADIITEWSRNNDMRINATKTK